jgi:hypothetical protein
MFQVPFERYKRCFDVCKRHFARVKFTFENPQLSAHFHDTARAWFDYHLARFGQDKPPLQKCYAAFNSYKRVKAATFEFAFFQLTERVVYVYNRVYPVSLCACFPTDTQTTLFVTVI